ncbi:MAG: ABC transporter ATP-binding protein, partial [Phycisphaerales bacterium]
MIETINLTKKYGELVALNNLNLSINDGDCFGFIGPNGAGKTTTIRVLLGLLRPSGGGASIFGLDCWKRSPRIKRDVGYLPGDLRLYPWMTARNAIGIVGQVRKRGLAERGRELWDRFELDPEVRVRQMSRGMRQKLGLVLALVHEPKLLILDEPTAGLDPLMQDVLYRCLDEAIARGQTVFFSSHRLSEVEHLCDRVAIIRDGRIVADEPLETLRGRAAREVKLEFADAEAAGRAEVPAFLKIRERRGAQWVCDRTGEMPDLIRWMAGQPIADVTIGPPDLESLFRRFYEREGDAG